jgi:serine/threonine protein kinase
MHCETGELLAVKEIKLTLDSPSAQSELEAMKSEIQSFMRLRHPNLVRYLGWHQTPTALGIVMEYVIPGSVAAILAKFGPFKEPTIRAYIRQVLQGVLFLHENKIVHR